MSSQESVKILVIACSTWMIAGKSKNNLIGFSKGYQFWIVIVSNWLCDVLYSWDSHRPAVPITDFLEKLGENQCLNVKYPVGVVLKLL